MKQMKLKGIKGEQMKQMKLKGILKQTTTTNSLSKRLILNKGFW